MQRWIDWVSFFSIKQYKIEGTINSYCTFILQKLKKPNFFCYRYRTCIGCLYYFFTITNHECCGVGAGFFGVEREPEFEGCCVSGSTLKDKKKSSKPQAKLFKQIFLFSFSILGRPKLPVLGTCFDL